MDYYLKYNYNPFLEYKPKDKLLLQNLFKEKKEKMVNIADQLTKNDDRLAHIRSNITDHSQHFDDRKNATSLFSDKVLNEIQKRNQ